jgi:uncharacterized protein (DUF4415 family)
MHNESATRRYPAPDLAARRPRGESRTDPVRVLAKSEAELERDIADDPDYRDVPENWSETATPVIPTAKRLVSLRIDDDVLDWFRRQGPGYQTRMNAVLRAYMRHAPTRPGREA